MPDRSVSPPETVLEDVFAKCVYDADCVVFGHASPFAKIIDNCQGGGKLAARCQRSQAQWHASSGCTARHAYRGRDNFFVIAIDVTIILAHVALREGEPR